MWHSVKEYKPVDDANYLVFDEKTGFIRIAYYELYVNGSFSFFDYDTDELIEVSHFMHIPPVKID